jgi:hypothetical protein
MWNGQCFVFSTERLFRINPTGQGNYIAQEVPNAEGLYGKYAFCVGPNSFWWVSRHGVQESNGSNVDSITNESLYPLFPHDGQAGEQIFDYYPFDLTNPDAVRLFYTRDSLYLTSPTTQPPEPPIVVPPTACGTLSDDLNLKWAHNARIGVFTNETVGEFFYIGADPNDPARLIAVKTVDFGETWALAGDSFSAHTDELAGFDCHQVQPDHALYSSLRNYVFVSMQENSTGRVSYAKFDLENSLWAFTDREVVATLDTTHNCTGITITSTGDIGIMYEASQETVGSPRVRNGYRYSDDDGLTWSAQLDIGSWGQSYSNRFGRPVSDNAGRVQIFMIGESTGFDEYMVQTILANHTLSAVTIWREGTGLSQIQSVGAMGDYCTFELAGTTQIVYTCRMLTTGRYTIFASSDSMTAPYQPPDVRDGVIGTTFNGLGGGTYEASYPQLSARFDGTNLHMMASSFSNSVPTYFYHKQADTPFAPGDFAPSGDADQSGPYFSVSSADIPGQEMAAQVIEVEGEQYYISLRDSGDSSLGLVFNFIKLDLLPTSVAETIEVWAAQCEST